MNKKNLSILLVICVAAFSYAILYYEKKSSIESYLDGKTDQYMRTYQLLYDENKKISKLIYDTHVNTDKVKSIFKDATVIIDQSRIRKELYKSLSDVYEVLKSFNIKQLHFHLPNNDSFLRFHRPKKFGDNLSDVRETVAYVNKNKKYIDGFEEGRIYNGYRFVYPMIYEGKHIGSVEISFSSLAMNIEFMKDPSIISKFLIFKDVVDKKVFKDEKSNYFPSRLEGLYVEKEITERIERDRDVGARDPISKKTINFMRTEAKTERSFSIYDEVRDEVLTFLKIKNPVTHKVVALFAVRSDANYIAEKENYFYLTFVLINLFIILVLLFAYKVKTYQSSIEKMNKSLEEKVVDEVAKNRKKDEYMLAQSRLAQMGEMISMIAHQWRQPLGVIASIILNIQMKYELEKFDFANQEEMDQHFGFIKNELKGIDDQVQLLSHTIDDFRTFYKPSKQMALSTLEEIVKSSMKMLNPIIKNSHIEIAQEHLGQEEQQLHINEVMHVILNILQNSLDNFYEKSTQNPRIFIRTDKNEILICDNGGGIPEDIIDKIFDPYFSTKKNKNGTGLGLYMSQMIIQKHHNGALSANNNLDGVCFSIKIHAQKGDLDG